MTNKEKYIQLCKTKIERSGINELLDWIENKSDFFTAPASSRFHGNYEGGLCEHSLNVCTVLEKLVELYGNPEIKNESIYITSLFHDLCKCNYYKKGFRNVKDDSGMWVKKETWEIDEKLPLGHGEKSCMILQYFMKLDVDELLAIRWHMSGFDSAVKGGDFSLNKANEISKLCTLVHVADLIASNTLEKTIT